MIRNDSVERTLAILSDVWAFLVLREIYLGARRFEQMQSVLHLPRSTLSDRLLRHVEAGIVRREPCRGSPGRAEYRLTDRGLDLYLVMLAMLRFGDDHLAQGDAPPLTLIHASCGQHCRPTTICSQCRLPVDALHVNWRDGPGAGFSPASDLPQRRRSVDPSAFERGRPSSVARTLSILADRWTFLVLRELFLGVRRFDGFVDRLGIASNILTDRLQRLVSQAIIKRIQYQEQPARYEYKLTATGRDLFSTFLEMMRWGDRWISEEKPIVLTHLDCGADFEPVLACDKCWMRLDPHHMRYRLNYVPTVHDHAPALLREDGDPTLA